MDEILNGFAALGSKSLTCRRKLLTMKQHFLPRLAFLLALWSAVAVRPAFAGDGQIMEVGFPRSFETKKIQLQEAERGIIEVHLASDGCMLDGYHISLVDESRRRVLKTLKSDETGILTFSKVPPGVYTVMVRHTKRTESLRSTVRVGDVLLSKRELANE